MKKSLFDPDVYNECLERIDQLNPDTQAKWGKMDVAQMLAHCAEVQEVGNGKTLKKTPLVVKLFRGMIKKIVISEKPYKHGEKTHPQYQMVNSKDFQREKKRLLEALEFFHNDKQEREHTLFGKMSVDERGWSMYKHLDHHLTQFDV